MSNTQSEYELELALMQQLEGLGYEVVAINNEASLLANLRQQLERHNQLSAHEKITDGEFKKIISHLNSQSTVFDRAKILRDKFALQRDNGDTKYISFLNTTDWCMNEYQVTHQVKQHDLAKNSRQTRYDVTILINGLPLIQVELKKRGLELKEAFNQINRYHRDSFWNGYGLFLYTQLYVISNGVNTKYYANNPKQSFEQTFYWSDINNQLITNLHQFSDVFLRPCHASKMITHYTVLNETYKCLMILRPYQFYAVEELIERAEKTNKNGYIWHTTGSGKTLTSFKASQVITKMPSVHKVLFVVDRKDLDYQTANEFNAFCKDSVDSTTNTRKLIEQLNNPDTKLIVTTIQKLNNAIMGERYKDKVAHLQDKKIVFIFDECHRSQFGDTHKNIKRFFNHAQMFGFTGTPILEANANNTQGIKQTTKDLFSECLHKYVIVDAIRDGNVLRFAVEYVGKYTQKDTANTLDIEVEAIDKKELIESPLRLSKITDYILTHHTAKTKRPNFTAMFCVGNIEMLTQYYELFKQRQQQLSEQAQANGLVYNPLKIATIFSYAANEQDTSADGVMDFIDEESPEIPTGSNINPSSRDKLDSYIKDYNLMFGTHYTANDTDSFYNYYKDIAKRVRRAEVDILLVVNMFLTGFDSPRLNTLYVDKNLRHHGLVQAFSRTNRILNEKKTQGNIICFRNLKQATDDAIALFSNKNAKETVLVEPYDSYLKKYQAAVEALLELTPTVGSVDNLADENEQLDFVTKYRELLRLKNVLSSFADYTPEDLSLDEQTFEDFKSKYLDLHDQVKRQRDTEKVSVLEDVDFELILIHRDEINVSYILKLLKDLSQMDEQESTKRTQDIMDLMSGETQLRSKKELIAAFIQHNLPKLTQDNNLEACFETFWDEQKKLAAETICQQEQLNPEGFKQMIETYLFANRHPREQEIAATLLFKPSILQRKTILQRIQGKIKDFIDTFIEGMGGIA